MLARLANEHTNLLSIFGLAGKFLHTLVEELLVQLLAAAAAPKRSRQEEAARFESGSENKWGGIAGSLAETD